MFIETTLTTNYRGILPNELRDKVIRKQLSKHIKRCCFCGEYLDNDATLEHIIPAIILWK